MTSSALERAEGREGRRLLQDVHSIGSQMTDQAPQRQVNEEETRLGPAKEQGDQTDSQLFAP